MCFLLPVFVKNMLVNLKRQQQLCSSGFPCFRSEGLRCFGGGICCLCSCRQSGGSWISDALTWADRSPKCSQPWNVVTQLFFLLRNGGEMQWRGGWRSGQENVVCFYFYVCGLHLRSFNLASLPICLSPTLSPSVGVCPPWTLSIHLAPPGNGEFVKRLQ